jgi:polysaccharide pyruvyl transferase WcaK-like protein
MRKILKKIKNLPFDLNYKKWRFIVNNSSKSDIKKTEVSKDWLVVNCSEKISINTIKTYKKIIIIGAKSDLDILNFISTNSLSVGSFVFVVRLLKSNHYQFGTKIIDEQNIIYLQGDQVNDLQDCFHRYNLIHKSYSLSKSWFWFEYYSKRIKNLTENREFIQFENISNFSIFFHQIIFFKELIFRKFDFRLKLMKISAFFNCLFRFKLKSLQPIYKLKHILITGWYGTETIGDKAILMEVIHSLKESNPGVKFSITSIIPGLSNLTNKELDLDLEIHELKKVKFSKLHHIDGVVFGGGPLMDSSQLKYIEVLFKWANALGKNTIIFGCGVGPIKKKINNKLISSILTNSSSAFFRDENSSKLAGELGFKGELLWSCDPALRFVRRWSNDNKKVAPLNKIVALLREQTIEYSGNSVNITYENIKIFNHFLNSVSSDFDIISLLPMHTFWYGNDDREYIKSINDYKVIPSFKNTSNIFTLHDLLANLKSSSFGLPMRYHGHIFMAAIGIPFISIDYTGKGGKISSFMNRYGLQKMSISTNHLNKNDVLSPLFFLMKNEKSKIKQEIKKQVDQDLNLLLNCYKTLGIHK